MLKNSVKETHLSKRWSGKVIQQELGNGLKPDKQAKNNKVGKISPYNDRFMGLQYSAVPEDSQHQPFHCFQI